MKLLLFLKQYEGDGKMYQIEHLFPEMSVNELKSILNELTDEQLIIFTGRESRNLSFLVEKNILIGESKVTESPLNKIINDTEPAKFKAKLTFKGVKYLKEEIEMKESGKYNINVSGEGTNNTFVIESKKVTVNNKPEFKNKIDKIIDALNSDQSINNELRQTAISDFIKARETLEEKGNMTKIMEKISQHGSEISSIGSLVLQLLGG